LAPISALHFVKGLFAVAAPLGGPSVLSQHTPMLMVMLAATREPWRTLATS